MFDIFVQIAERTSPIPDLTQEWKESQGKQTHCLPEPSVNGRTLQASLLFDQQKIQFFFIVHIDYLRTIYL